MTLDPKMNAFFAVAEAGAISLAADRLGMTQPALSKLIQRVEHEYGAQLFVRSRRGVALTPEGEILRRHAQNAAIEIDHAREEIAALRSDSKVELRLHCGILYALDWIHEPVREIAERNPHVDFIIEATAYRNTVPRLLLGDFDAVFGFVGDAANDPRLDYTPIHDVETLVFCRNDHKIRAEVVERELLVQQNWCQFTEVFHTNEALEKYLLSISGHYPRIQFRSGALATAIELVRRTDALICLPSPLVKYAADLGLRVLKTREPIWTYQTGCLIRRSSKQYDLVASLLALVAKYAAQVRRRGYGFGAER